MGVGCLVTLGKLSLAECKPVFLRMASLMAITNGQLATSSYTPGNRTGETPFVQ